MWKRTRGCDAARNQRIHVAEEHASQRSRYSEQNRRFLPRDCDRSNEGNDDEEDRDSSERMSLLCSRVSRRLDERMDYNRFLVDLLIVVFGISAWIGVNGIFVQLPLLVKSAPEGWGLPAYLVILIQSANIGPIIFALSQRIAPNLLSESVWISGLLVIGTVAMGLLAFLYDTTTMINGTEHSTVLFVLVFATALVGCTSSVLFMPYLRNFDEARLVSYFIGEGLSGLLPSIVALIQGVDEGASCSGNATQSGDLEPITAQFSARFPPRDYFLFLFVVLACSTCAFWILEYLPLARRQRITLFSVDENARNVPITSNEAKIQNKRYDDYVSCEEHHANKLTATDLDARTGLEASLDKRMTDIEDQPNSEAPITVEVDEEPRPRSMNVVRRNELCVLMGLICFGGNGFLPGVQSFSCLPYGDVAYHLTASLSHLANPAACTFALWVTPIGPKGVTRLSVLAVASGAYVTWLALSSPTPVLRESTLGVALVVLAWIVLTGLVSYTKLAIVTIFRREPGHNALFYVGVVTQAGSALGAVLSFVLVNYTSLFLPYVKICDPISI